MGKSSAIARLALALSGSFVCATFVPLASGQQPQSSSSSASADTSKEKASANANAGKADNPKKPAAKKNASSEKVKTEDRMSTRGLTPPKDKDSDKSQSEPTPKQ
jgi:hypothetical protein